MRYQNILGVHITNDSEIEILEFITKSLKMEGKKLFMVTPNPEMMVYANKHPSFKLILNSADIALPDGVGVLWAAKLLGKRIPYRITGVDLMEKLCQDLAKENGTAGFLGGREGVAEKTAECLKQKYPGLKVGFAGGEWPEKLDGRKLRVEDSSLKIEDGRWKKRLYPQPSTLKNLSSIFYHPSSHIDILFVAFGFPKQEEWIYNNLDRIPVKVAIGVGGAFDYISGQVPRAPQFVRNLGFEWLFRLIVQPWRIKRQIALIEFGWLVAKEIIKPSHFPT